MRSKTLATRAKTKTHENIYSTFTVSCEKSKMVSFISSIIQNIILLFAPARLPRKLINYIAFGSASSACYLVQSIAIILCFLK